MTTILADANKGVMVADSCMSNGDRAWSAKKIHRIHGMLVGLAGDASQGIEFLRWWQSRCLTKPPRFDKSAALVMFDDGLMCFTSSCTPEYMPEGVEAIGSGSKAAICVYEATGYADPVATVRLVCKHDAGSRGPVKTYRL